MNASAGLTVDITAIQVVEAKILHVLSIYPKISRPMLQTGIGPSMNPAIWHPVLEDLRSRRLVEEVELSRKGPTGRNNTYRILQLTAEGQAWVGSIGRSDVAGDEASVAETHTQGRSTAP